MAIIYKITNMITGKIYVGKSVRTLEERRKEHFAGHMKNRKKVLYKAMRAHGFENFSFEVIAEADEKDIDELEKKLIQELGALVSQHGYNVALGGEGGDTFTNNPNRELIRSKFSKSGEKNPFYGKRHSEETRQAIAEKTSKLHKGVKRNKETCEKLRQNALGRSHTEETKQKISRLKLGTKHTPEARKKIAEASTWHNGNRKVSIDDEKEIVRMIVAGCSNKEIREKFNISPSPIYRVKEAYASEIKAGKLDRA